MQDGGGHFSKGADTDANSDVCLRKRKMGKRKPEIHGFEGSSAIWHGHPGNSSKKFRDPRRPPPVRHNCKSPCTPTTRDKAGKRNKSTYRGEVNSGTGCKILRPGRRKNEARKLYVTPAGSPEASEREVKFESRTLHLAGELKKRTTIKNRYRGEHWNRVGHPSVIGSVDAKRTPAEGGDSLNRVPPANLKNRARKSPRQAGGH